jgi:hypothetical protein
MKKIIFDILQMTSFYIQKMVFTKSKNFDERGGEDYFFLLKECGVWERAR